MQANRMADPRFPGTQRGVGLSRSPAANPEVKRLIGVSDPYTVAPLDLPDRLSQVSSQGSIEKLVTSTVDA